MLYYYYDNISNKYNAKNGGGADCVWSASYQRPSREWEKMKKKCCLAKGVDVIKTTATNCSFVLERGGVNFGHVFSVSLTHTHTHERARQRESERESAQWIRGVG